MYGYKNIRIWEENYENHSNSYLLAIGVMFCWTPRADATCSCFHVLSAQYTCQVGTCRETINIHGCGGIQNSCEYCDPFLSLKFCCGDCIGDAGLGGLCTGSPEARAEQAKTARIVVSRLYIPTSDGGYQPLSVFMLKKGLWWEG